MPILCHYLFVPAVNLKQHDCWHPGRDTCHLLQVSLWLIQNAPFNKVNHYTHYLFAPFLHLAGSFLLSSSLCLPSGNDTMMQFDQFKRGDCVPFTLPAGSCHCFPYTSKSHGAVTDPIQLARLGGKTDPPTSIFFHQVNKTSFTLRLVSRSAVQQRRCGQSQGHGLNMAIVFLAKLSKRLSAKLWGSCTAKERNILFFLLIKMFTSL